LTIRPPILGDQRIGGAAVLAQCLNPVAKDVFALDQHVADVDADPPLHSALGGGPGIAFCRQAISDWRSFGSIAPATLDAT
jgi:hypothetical protein